MVAALRRDGWTVNRKRVRRLTLHPAGEGVRVLVAVMDWFSRRVLAWRLSTGMETGFCVEALQDALDRHGSPEIFNSDQGVQFTSAAFTGVLAASGAASAWMAKAVTSTTSSSTTMAQPEIRGHLHQGLRLGPGGASWHRRLAELLQRRTPASGPGLSDPMRGFPGEGILWICGPRQRVAHIPTGPSSTARKGSNRIGKGAIIRCPRARVGGIGTGGSLS